MKEYETKQHRGRFQAQGKSCEKSSSWAQDLGITLTEGHSLLDNLKASLTRTEQAEREIGFSNCRRAIENAYTGGGIYVGEGASPFIKSFPKGYNKRIDLEVRRGEAFKIKSNDEENI